MTNVNEHFSCFSPPKAFALSSCHELQPLLSFELPTLPMSLSGHASQTLPVPQKGLARQIDDSKQRLALSERKRIEVTSLLVGTSDCSGGGHFRDDSAADSWRSSGISW